MKAIMDQYGPAILTAIVVVAIFGIIFTIPDGKGNIGILEIMAANSDMDNSMYESMTDTKAVVEENSAIAAPTLSYASNLPNMKKETSYMFGNYINVCVAGNTNYKLSDALSSASGKITYKILSITASNGSSCIGLYNNITGMIKFPNAGTYTVVVRCNDLTNGKETTARFLIPVDN